MRDILSSSWGENRKWDEGQSHHAIDRDCEQLFVFPFSYKIEQNEPPMKFNAFSCPNYQGIKDTMTHVLHFKISIVLISITQDKRDTMICKLFVGT